MPGDSVHGSSGASPLWSYLDASTDSKQKAVITAAPTVAYDMLLVSQVKGQGGQLTALPLDVPAGQVPEPKWICPTDLRLYESAQVWNGLAFFVDGAAGEANRKLYCVNLFEQGRIEWTRGILPFSTGFATAAAGEVFVQDEPGMLRSLNRAGHEQWALPLGELSVPVGVTGTMVIAAVRQPSFLVVLDRLTGRVLGTRSITKEIQGELSCDGNKIYIGTNAGVVQYDLAGLGAEP
ncbi:MAG: hypothetical protein JXA82_09305 [Sedimentisphaerales bacterium]|nr:hypothetical protein [Sedimentisphaerales bacterium]